MLEPLPGRVRVERDVAIGPAGSRELRCDVYRPPTEGSGRTSVLVIHGGAWREGDRAQLQGYAVQLARRGLVAVACEYRLSHEAPWPAQRDDVAAALGWMRRVGTDLGIHTDRITALGASAGGHLALMLATEQPVAAVVGLYPATRLQPGGPDDAASRLLGPGADATAFELASPLAQVGKGFPPTLLLHGGADELVPAEDSNALYRRLRQLGTEAELHLFAGLPHAFDLEPDYGRQCLQLITLFLERQVLRRGA